VLPGSPGGRLFQVFILAFGGKTSYRQGCTAWNQNNPSIWAVLLAKEKLGFYNFVITSIFGMGRRADQQMTLRNVLAESTGLSKTGRILFSKLGCMLSERTFQRRLVEFDDVHDELARF